MNVTLIYPLLSKRRAERDENKQFWPPLGLGYIAAVLERDGHRVQIIDRDVILRRNNLNFCKTDAITLEGIKEFRTDIVGISATTPNIPDVAHISSYIKRYKDIFTVLGGPHATGEPELSLKELKDIDIVVRGEGEGLILKLAQGGDPEGINGLAFRRGSKIVQTPQADAISELDALPLPARHLMDMAYYTRPSRFTSRNLSLRTTSIFTARGCPYRCNFCAGPLIFKGRVRYHSPARVMQEVEELVNKYSVEALYFAEDMFLSDRKRAGEILDLFIKNGYHKKIKWIAQAKANVITEELLLLMKRSGCIGVEYGFESGSQRILDLMNKRLKVEEGLKAACLTRKAGLRFQANIIVGYPGERQKDFSDTISFIKKIKPNMIGFNIFMPLPGTPDYEKLKARGEKLPAWADIGDQEAPHVNYADMPKGVFEKLYHKTRLMVILPMNLRSFLSDNICQPRRLLNIVFTQFGGIIKKTVYAAWRLASGGRPPESSKTRVLFLSYNGLLEAILPSQAVPYLAQLHEDNLEFILITYEKRKELKAAGKAGILEMRNKLRERGIEWHYLRYHKKPPIAATLFDLFIGTIYISYLMSANRIKMVHVRGITPGVIIILLSRIFKVKVLFDMRGLLAEEYVGGGLWKEGSLPFKLVKSAERRMLKTADAITVLTKRHLEFNKSLPFIQEGSVPMDVIPCCVDTDMFKYDHTAEEILRKELGLENKFVLMYPGKIGTFYLMKEMIDFYAAMVRRSKDSVFLIVSNDDPKGIIARARSVAGGEDKIRIISGVRFEDMPRYVRIADAGIFFINPYKKFGSSPIKMGEFLASGVPVVINPGVGDTEELVSENRVGVIVKQFTEDDYRDGVARLFGLHEEGSRLRERCRETAEKNLSLKNGVARYREIYNALI
jgi:radical SAM superfamily enzyme YgiQ (UPF0313 family)/glycosyltransferase involved in cell wall biosynthesis